MADFFLTKIDFLLLRPRGKRYDRRRAVSPRGRTAAHLPREPRDDDLRSDLRGRARSRVRALLAVPRSGVRGPLAGRFRPALDRGGTTLLHPRQGRTRARVL